MNYVNKNGLIYLAAIILIVFGVIAWPSSQDLKVAKQTLNTTNTAIKKDKQKNIKISQVDDHFDLSKAENDAGQKISEGVGLALGGIHSDDEFNQNKSKLQADLGNKLTKELVGYSQDRNTKQYLATKNDGVQVAFDKVVDPTNTTVYVTTQFDRNDKTTKYVFIEGSYNLKTQQFKSFSINPLSKAPTTHEGSN